MKLGSSSCFSASMERLQNFAEAAFDFSTFLFVFDKPSAATKSLNNAVKGDLNYANKGVINNPASLLCCLRSCSTRESLEEGNGSNADSGQYMNRGSLENAPNSPTTDLALSNVYCLEVTQTKSPPAISGRSREEGCSIPMGSLSEAEEEVDYYLRPREVAKDEENVIDWSLLGSNAPSRSKDLKGPLDKSSKTIFNNTEPEGSDESDRDTLGSIMSDPKRVSQTPPGLGRVRPDNGDGL